MLAFSAYDQVKNSGTSMKGADLHQAVFDKYHGKGENSIISVEKFLRGEEMFAGVYEQSHDVTGRSQSVLKQMLSVEVQGWEPPTWCGMGRLLEVLMMKAYFPRDESTSMACNTADVLGDQPRGTEEDDWIKDWESQLTYPGFMAWGFWGHTPMSGMDNEYRTASFLTGDNSTDESMASKRARGLAAARYERQEPVRKKVKREEGRSKHGVC